MHKFTFVCFFYINKEIDIGTKYISFCIYFSGWKKTNFNIIWNHLFGKPYILLFESLGFSYFVSELD